VCQRRIIEKVKAEYSAAKRPASVNCSNLWLQGRLAKRMMQKR